MLVVICPECESYMGKWICDCEFKYSCIRITRKESEDENGY